MLSGADMSREQNDLTRLMFLLLLAREAATDAMIKIKNYLKESDLLILLSGVFLG